MKYKVASMVTQESENVYLITAVLPNKLGQYELFINEKDFGFLRINFKGQMNGDSVLGKELMPWVKKTSQAIFMNNTLVFRKYNNLYFRNYIKLNWKTRTLSDLTLDVIEK